MAFVYFTNKHVYKMRENFSLREKHPACVYCITGFYKFHENLYVIATAEQL